MAKRKYEYQILFTECNEENYNNYSEAVSAYGKVIVQVGEQINLCIRI